MIRNTPEDGDSTIFAIPITLFDVNASQKELRGTTGNVNAYRFHEGLKSMFDQQNIEFISGCFDGAIFDKNRRNFVLKVKDHWQLKLAEINFFTCNTHSGGLITNLSAVRCLKDYGLKLDKKDLNQADPDRKCPNIIWFNGEKDRYEDSFRTFNAISKLLGRKSKKKKMNLAEFVNCMAKEDAQMYKDAKQDNPQRTNSIFVRWCNYYFKTKETPPLCALRLIKENDKKLRRYYCKAYRIIDNIQYLSVAIQRNEFSQFFEHIKSTKIDENFIHMKSQWCALIKFLWSVNDSSQKGFNCSLLRTLVIVLKANTESTRLNVPLENVLLR